jgi:hypothetical protein
VAATDDEFARLDAEGVPAHQLIVTSYFFSHFGASAGERQAFRDALAAAGFADLGADTEGSDPNYLHYWSHTIRSASRDELRAADRLAAVIAHEHGVRYDGWEVARSTATGELHPVE